MGTNPNIRVTDNVVEQNAGAIWQRLHSEREDICEALLQEPVPGPATAGNEESIEAAPGSSLWHRELLHSRLHKIDDALDRLMSGSYGNCSECGKWIEDPKLEFDPAIAFCIGCWQRQQSQARPPYALPQSNSEPMHR